MIIFIFNKKYLNIIEKVNVDNNLMTDGVPLA
jgi:hypothetical protein